MKFRALLFDVDGTAVDLETRNKTVLQNLCAEAGFDLKDEYWSYFVGRIDSDKWLMLTGQDPSFPYGDPSFKDFYPTAESFENKCEQEYEGYTGAVNAIHQTQQIVFEFIENKKDTLAVSNSTVQNVQKNLKLAGYDAKMDLSDSAASIVGLDFVQASGGSAKPSKDPYEIALNRINMSIADNALHLKPEDCLVLEDSITGVRSALKFGATVIQIIDNCDCLDEDEVAELTKSNNGRYICVKSDELYKTYLELQQITP